MNTKSDRRISQPLSAVALVLALAAMAACEKPKAPVETVQTAPVTDAPGCDVARAYVAGRLGRVHDKVTVVVDVAAPGTAALATMTSAHLVAKYDPGQENPSGWTKDPPPAALAQAWLSAAQASPFAACRDFNAVVTGVGVQMGVVTSTEKPRKDAPERTQMNFTVPVISTDGAEALSMETGRSGQGSQVSILVHLRKDKDGVWSEADALVLAMS